MKKQISYFIFLLSATVAFHLNAQVIPQYEWAHCYGGSKEDYARNVKQTHDKGYITAGWTFSDDGDVTGNHGNSDCWIVKTDSFGLLQWEKCLGGTYNESAYAIQTVKNNGYIIIGSSNSNDGDVSGHHGEVGSENDDVWVVKIKNNGNIEWQKSLGGTNQDRGSDIQSTRDGGFILTGYSFSSDGDLTGNNGQSDVWVVKLDSTGSIQWQKNFGGSNSDMGNSVLQTSDGGYIVAGYTSLTNYDINALLIKLDKHGNLVWSSSMGGSQADIFSSVVQSNDGSYIAAGYTFSSNGDVHGQHGEGDWWVVWIDSTGQILKDKCYGGSGQEFCNSITRVNDGTFLLSGDNGSGDGDASVFYGFTDFWIINIDTAGTILWQNSYGAEGNEFCTSALLNSHNEMIAAGSTSSDFGMVVGNHGYQEDDYWLVKKGTPPNLIYTYLTDTNYCPGSEMAVSYTASGNFNEGNIFSVQLTGISGTFNDAQTIGSVEATTDSVIDCILPGVINYNYYRARVVSSNPVWYGIDNGSPISIRCHAPIDLTTSDFTPTSAKLSWGINSNCNVSYEINYRPASSIHPWRVVMSDSNSVIVTNLHPSTTYKWRVETLCNMNTRGGYINGPEFSTSPLKESVNETNTLSLSLYPNPTSNKAVIEVFLPENSLVKINLVDLQGSLLKTIAEGNFDEGTYQFYFEKANLSSGIYFLQLKTDRDAIIEKLVID